MGITTELTKLGLRATILAATVALAGLLPGCWCMGGSADAADMAWDDGVSAESAGSMPVAPEPTQRPTKPLMIEESDIYKLDGDWLYVLNERTGLNAVDVSDAREPRLTARQQVLAGQGGELYVRGDSVYALVEDSGLACHDLAPPEYRALPSTAVAAVVEPTIAPEVVASRCLPGSLVASRVVGEVLYVVTTGAPTQPWQSWLFSLDVTAPANLHVIEHEALTGAAHEVHVTDSVIYVTEESQGGTTVRYIDISSRDGSLVERGSLWVTGTPMGRFHMDEHEDTFRIVTRASAGPSSILHVIDVSNPDALRLMSSLPNIAPGEELFATRFVGEKAYVVTYQPEIVVRERVILGGDPLWVISLEDPTQPRILGELEIPGWSDYIFPRGDLLLAVGRGESGDRVAASLFDVTDPTRPTELRRLEFGMNNASSEAASDFRAVQIIDQELDGPPLIVVPYSNNVGLGAACVPEHRIQLIDLEGRDLRLRGDFWQQGRVLRTLPIGGELYSVTSKTVASNDVSNRDAPHINSQVAVGDLDAREQCVLPPPEPQQEVWVDQGWEGGEGWSGDSESDLCGCSVAESQTPCVGRHAWWLLAAAMVGMRLRAMRRRQKPYRQADSKDGPIDRGLNETSHLDG